MIDKFSVYYNGEEVGMLTLKQQGIYTMASCTCRKVTSGIMRLICIGTQGAKSVGVMMPEGLKLILGKKMTKSDMKTLGICDTARFELMASIPTEDYTGNVEASQMKDDEDDTVVTAAPSTSQTSTSSWQLCQSTQGIFTDEDIAHACRNVKDALIRTEDDMTLFAVPLRTDAPFPMMPVFCFGQCQRIDSKEYVVFKVKNGELVV